MVIMILYGAHLECMIVYYNQYSLCNAGTDINSFKDHLSLTPSHERDLSLFHSDLPIPVHTHESDSEGTKVHGKVVKLNGRELALFCYKDKFYAVTEKCPHMGKSLI